MPPVATITYEIPSTETIKLSGNFSHSGLPHQTRAGVRTVRTNIKGSIRGVRKKSGLASELITRVVGQLE